MANSLSIKNLYAQINDKKILKGFNLEIKPGEIHAIMGPNGSGKSTLCNVLMGHPKYSVSKGSAKLGNINLFDLETNKRANAGLFLAFQHPMEIPGVGMGSFIRQAVNANIKANDKNTKPIGPMEFLKEIQANTKLLKMDEAFIGRSLNEGFSGGEKKRAEIVQMASLKPKFALLDEIDSGLDIDALKAVAKGIKAIHKKQNTGILLITHYQRILNFVEPDFVHIMNDGKIIKSGGKELAHKLEEKGYEAFIK